MATNIQRAQAICDAIMNKTVTTAQMMRLGSALAQQAGRSAEFDSATNDQKARFLVAQVRAFCVNTVIAAESSTAANAAAAIRSPTSPTASTSRAALRLAA